MPKKTMETVESLKRENERLRKEVERLENRIFCRITFDEEQLKSIVIEQMQNVELDIKAIQTEARKEFAERLKERNRIYCINAEDAKEMDFVIDNLVKEMEVKA